MDTSDIINLASLIVVTIGLVGVPVWRMSTSVAKLATVIREAVMPRLDRTEERLCDHEDRIRSLELKNGRNPQ